MSITVKKNKMDTNHTDRTIAVMWTHINWGVPGLWNPNHFVPLASTVSNDQKPCHSDTVNTILPDTPVARAHDCPSVFILQTKVRYTSTEYP